MAYQGWKGDMGRVDPAMWVEMQAQYLRMLADMYAEEPKPAHGRTRSAFVQAGPTPPIDYQTPPHSHLKPESSVRSLPTSLPRASVDSSPPVRPSEEAEEKPIHGVSKKFEDFLEEEMRKESSGMVQTPGLKREFLKRRSQSVAFQMRSRGRLEEGKESGQESLSPPADTRPSLRKTSPVSKRDQTHQPNQSPLRQDSEIRRLSSENAHLREENLTLKGHIHDLEARLSRLQAAFSKSPGVHEESKVPSPAKTGAEPPMDMIRLIEAGETQATPVATVESEGVREVLFKRGGKKLVYPDGRATVYFKNSDVKDVYPDGKVVYRFAQTDTVQTTFPDGLQIFQFANGQLEKHFPNKHKEINFPDGTVKKISPNGGEETIFPDGTVQKVEAGGEKHIDYVNGQKETVKTDGTRVREWPDGTVKTFPPKK